MVAPTSHSNSRAELARCAHFCCHVARSAPFRADTVLRSHSLNGMTSGRELRNMHGEHDSPCIFRTAGHDNQKRDLWPCRTHDMPLPASEKPVRHHDFPTVALYTASNMAVRAAVYTVKYRAAVHTVCRGACAYSMCMCMCTACAQHAVQSAVGRAVQCGSS